MTFHKRSRFQRENAACGLGNLSQYALIAGCISPVICFACGEPEMLLSGISKSEAYWPFPR